ncbi:MAG: hypothetical protein EXQ94_08355 [Alphaproteobacteria bacterium]|nr:hypothetical protein [Alphaproteobacteria bacterium]
MYYVELIARDRVMPIEIFRQFADQSSSWVEGAVDRMVLQLGRTMRLGPHPSYLALWRIPDIGRLDAWEEYFSSAPYLAGGRRSHAMHRAIDIASAGLYDALHEDGTTREGLHYVEFFAADAADGAIADWFWARRTRYPEAKLGYVLRRVGLLGPDPAHLAVWTFADYAASEPFARDAPPPGPVAIREAGAYRWLGQEIL